VTGKNRDDKVALIDEKGLRTDGRRPDELRPIRLEIGYLSRADGSAYIEQGKNKIVAAVYGPRELHPRHLAQSDRALLRVNYRMATFSVQERKKPAPSRREYEISMVIRQALEPMLFLKMYPRAAIDVFIQVLQADGGSRCASTTAASLALADAGIPMRALVAGCAVGKVDGQIVVDLSDIEDKMGDADVPVVMAPSRGELTLLQMDGKLTSAELTKALDMAETAIKKIYDMQQSVLQKTFAQIREEIGEEAEAVSPPPEKEAPEPSRRRPPRSAAVKPSFSEDFEEEDD
jgi:exosome complex component RRP41